MMRVITSESVNIGHPDKTCDVIADAFLDEALRQDKNSQMAVECAIKNDKLFIYGEATTKAKIDYEKIAKEILKDIGYSCEFKIVKEISEQSPDIRQAVVKKELCANDQGMVFGYATKETPEFMPLPIMIAHRLMRRFEEFRRGTKTYFADAKCQVSIAYDGKTPKEIVSVIISVSHDKALRKDEIESDIASAVVRPSLKEYSHLVSANTSVIINPSGKSTSCPTADSGCVGRKIIVDTYGGVGRVGGGCFSSKNATKVDRSGAYYARYVAKNIVANGYADECEIEVSYAIGLKEPTSIYIECFGTNKKPMGEIESYVQQNFSFKPGDMIEELGLLRPIYKQTACYGHFGREEFPWERIKKE